MMRLSIIAIPVSDQARAKAFYRDVLSFRVEQDVEMGPTLRWVRLMPPSGAASVALVTWYPDMPAGCLRGLVLETIDIENAHAKLTGSGLKISAIETESWGRYATFADPDGNGWLLAEQRHLTPPSPDEN